MSKPTLPPDPESEKLWQSLPQNPPSRQALPPAAGGTQAVRWLLVLIALTGVIMLAALLFGQSIR